MEVHRNSGAQAISFLNFNVVELFFYRCVVAYASDLIFLQVSVNPHRARGLKPSAVSLDHT